MNSKTYEVFKANAMETASMQADPISYLASWQGLNVVIDEETPDNVTEVWFKDVYEFTKELERIKKETKGNDT